MCTAQVLGLTVDEASVMDDAGLRAVFRARSREVHPDLNPTATYEDGVPTVYEVNLAYEAVCKML